MPTLPSPTGHTRRCRVGLLSQVSMLCVVMCRATRPLANAELFILDLLIITIYTVCQLKSAGWAIQVMVPPPPRRRPGLVGLRFSTSTSSRALSLLREALQIGPVPLAVHLARSSAKMCANPRSVVSKTFIKTKKNKLVHGIGQSTQSYPAHSA